MDTFVNHLGQGCGDVARRYVPSGPVREERSTMERVSVRPGDGRLKIALSLHGMVLVLP